MRAARALPLVLGLTALVVVVTTPSAVARATAKFTIRSTLDGKRVLPHRITWIAYPSAPVNFPGVEFLIDGHPVFDNRLAPFAFGADGRDEVTKTVRTGYLVTSWLSPGRHEFTVRATSQGANRQTATKTVVAQVRAAPTPPAGLVGAWQRTVPTAVRADRGALYTETAPAGQYTMVVDQRFIQHRGPSGLPTLQSDYVAGPRTLTVGAPVWTFAAGTEGGWCDPWGPEARYAWSVSGDTLTLAPAGESDACNKRGAIFTGEWTRVG